jgi:hypothetical protein
MPLTDLVRQVSILMSLPAVVLMALAAAIMVIARDWRIVLFAYGLLSTMLALLLSQAVPTEWALLQAIVGGLVAVMLFLSARQLRWARLPGASPDNRWPQLASLTSFRCLAVVLAIIAFLVIRGRIQFPEVNPLFRDAILWLAMMGITGLALHEEPLHAGLALLMVLSGTLLLLYSLMQSRMIVGLIEAWQLLLGLAISYLTVARGLAGNENMPPAQTLRWRP